MSKIAIICVLVTFGLYTSISANSLPCDEDQILEKYQIRSAWWETVVLLIENNMFSNAKMFYSNYLRKDMATLISQKFRKPSRLALFAGELPMNEAADMFKAIFKKFDNKKSVTIHYLTTMEMQIKAFLKNNDDDLSYTIKSDLKSIVEKLSKKSNEVLNNISKSIKEGRYTTISRIFNDEEAVNSVMKEIVSRTFEKDEKILKNLIEFIASLDNDTFRSIGFEEIKYKMKEEQYLDVPELIRMAFLVKEFDEKYAREADTDYDDDTAQSQSVLQELFSQSIVNVVTAKEVCIKRLENIHLRFCYLGPSPNATEADRVTMTKCRKCFKWIFETSNGYDFFIKSDTLGTYLVPGEIDSLVNENERPLYLKDRDSGEEATFYWTIEPVDEGRHLVIKSKYYDEYLMAHFAQVKAYTTPLEHQNVYWQVTNN